MIQARAALLATLALGLSSCNPNASTPPYNNLKLSLDQLVAIAQDIQASGKDVAASARSSAEQVRVLAARIEALEKALARQKRAALFLPLEAETVCENDALCTETARVICNKINYPNAVPSRFVPGNRPVLTSVVCYD